MVPDGPGAVDIQGCCIQSLKSRPLGPGEERDIPDPFSAAALAGSGKVLQMLWLGMHDVEMVRQGLENGILRTGGKSAAKPVFRLVRGQIAPTRGCG